MRIWKDYVAPTANLDQKDRQFVAKVSEFINHFIFVLLTVTETLML